MLGLDSRGGWRQAARDPTPLPADGRLRCRRPTWTPDGRLIVTLAEGRVRILDGEPEIQRSNLELIDVRTGAQRTILKSTGWAGDVVDAAVSPNGRKVLYTRWNSARSEPPFGKALFAVNMDGTNDHQVASWELGGGDHAVFSPHGSILFRSFERRRQPAVGLLDRAPGRQRG